MAEDEKSFILLQRRVLIAIHVRSPYSSHTAFVPQYSNVVHDIHEYCNRQTLF